ncbi:uncharacterized protein LOC113866894 [Abrus precatorius]|uniref:Uncharacterized protein LOC113866894 n=1 Tax=Abrus precatorius TaxID=3816 RepID=A0A8B8LPZ2_ABRPR|nr:uncharacterized protein LOC113866894 [Abrus precatorius]
MYLKLQRYRQNTVSNTHFHKLVARFYGPFKIIERIGKVAYKLDLPPSARIHNVFHVSLLKKYYGDNVCQPLAHKIESSRRVGTLNGAFQPPPLAILDRRMKKRNNKAITEVLVQWQETSLEDAVWRDLQDMITQFPNFNWHAN